MTWVLILSVFALVLALVLIAETLRREPLWRRPERMASPRQRRWIGLCLVFVMAGNIVNWMNTTGRAEQGLLAFGLIGFGLIALVVGVVRGPTEQERERRQQLLQQQDRGD